MLYFWRTSCQTVWVQHQTMRVRSCRPTPRHSMRSSKETRILEACCSRSSRHMMNSWRRVRPLAILVCINLRLGSLAQTMRRLFRNWSKLSMSCSRQIWKQRHILTRSNSCRGSLRRNQRNFRHSIKLMRNYRRTTVWIWTSQWTTMRVSKPVT